jgi:hypothetical protein
MKEVRLKNDEYGSIDVRTLKPNEYMKIKLDKTNKAYEKKLTRKADNVEFVIYSIHCIHDGEPTYLRLTPSLAKKMQGFEVGQVLTVLAIASELRGGKAYSISSDEASEESTDLFTEDIVLTDKNKEDFDKILEQLSKKEISLTDVDDAIVIKALSGRLGYTLSDAELLVKEFFKYAKGK